MQLIISHDIGTLQGGHSVQLVIPHDIGDLQGDHSVLLIIPHHVVALQGGNSVLFIISYRGLSMQKTELSPSKLHRMGNYSKTDLSPFGMFLLNQ